MWTTRSDEELLTIAARKHTDDWRRSQAEDRRGRRRRVAVPVLAAVALATGIVTIASAGFERDGESPAATVPVCSRVSDVPLSTAPVDARLLALLSTLREAPPASQGAGCAERAPLSGGPTIHGSARWVAPGVGGGDIYLVAVEGPNAASRSQPAACLVTVDGLAAQFDPTGQCFPVDQIAAGHAIASSEITPPAAEALQRAGLPERLRAGSFVSLVVPDRVATVELRYADGASTTERVNHNVVIAHVPRDASAALPETIAWHDAGGRPIEPGTTSGGFDLAKAMQELATAPAPLAGIYAQANTLIDAGAAAFGRQLAALKGTPVVVHYWASWCTPCRAEVPVFQQATVTHGSEIAREQRLESYFPVTQFIGRDGATVHVHAGAYSSVEQLTRDIERYLR